MGKGGNKRSITYFGDIAKFDMKDFKKAIKDINIKEYENELVEQIYISSKIAIRKHAQFKDAIFTFFGGSILLAVSFLIFKI